MTTVAAVIFAVVTAGVIVFQIGLALGAPWGAYAMGGRFPGPYPAGMRVAAIVQAVALAVLAVIVLSSAGLVVPSLSKTFPWLVWVPVAFSAVSLVLNLITPSAGERRIWAPVGAVLLASSLTVALTGG